MLLKKTSLAVKLIVIIVVGVSIIFITAFVFNYYSLKKFYLNSARNNARDLTRIVSEHVNATLGGVQKVTATMATVVEKEHYTEAELIGFLEIALTHNPEIYALTLAYEPYAFDPGVAAFAPFVYREQGKIKVSQAPSNYPYWLWYSAPKAEDRPVWGDPYVNTATDSLSTTCSVLEQRLYSGDRLMAAVRDNRGDSAEALMKAVRASAADFAHGAPQADDITILAARLKHLKTRTGNS